MMRVLLCVAALAFGSYAALAESSDEAAYDLLFRNGTLDDVPKEDTLIYSRAVMNALKPEAAERDTGDIAMSFATGAAVLAQLEFRRDDKHRGLGKFPASVGNPMIMYFYESTIRDMAEVAGGSPFYIRNRIKDALTQPNDVVDGQAVVGGQTVETKIVHMYPFADDPNAARMQGFEDLELKVVMSEDVPGWYIALVASAGDVYRSELEFKLLESQK